MWGLTVLVLSIVFTAEHLPEPLFSYRTCDGGMGWQVLSASSVSNTLGRIHWMLFCSPVLQMWSRMAARIERPHSISPLVMEATATSKAASFSCTAPKSGMIFTASTYSSPARPRLKYRVLLSLCLLPNDRRDTQPLPHARSVASASVVIVATLEALRPALASRPPASACRCSPPDPPAKPSPRAACPG